jgi:HEPN domain-containing protein
MKKQFEDWILLADEDMRAAEILLMDEYPLTNIAAFHCQQAIEKYLKAFLIEKNIPLIKTHDLIKLNGMVNEIEKLSIDEKRLLVINEVYTESRYPGELGLMPDGTPTGKAVHEFLEYAKEIRAIISRALTG